MYQKHLKDVCLDKYQTIWIYTNQIISVDLEKIVGHKIVFWPCFRNEKGR